MAFCKFCGSKLEDGQLCNCEGAVAERAAAANAQAAAPVAPAAPVEQPTPAPAPAAQPVQAAAPAPAPVAQPVQQAAPVQQPVQQAAPVQQPQAQAVQQPQAQAVQQPQAQAVQQPVQQAPNMQYQGQPQGQFQGQYQQVQPAVTVDTEKIKAEARNSFANILTVFKAPITGGAAYMSGKNYIGSAVLLFIQVLVTSFFALFYGIGFNSAIDKLSDQAGYLSYILPFDDFKMSLVTAFFLTFLFVIITMAVIGGAFFTGALILKLDFKITNVLDLLGYRAIFTIPATIISLLFSIISAGFGLIFFYAIGLIILGFVVAALMERYAYKKDAILYMSLIVLVILVIVFTLVYSKVSLLYVPEIKEIIG
ncbi:hypothetical protein [Butyrivibrio proteoclasticus]|uniref:hypothetical protein n=1 Tax=Butyrivibrio proteoclasticus TaxID=43305 RepID=UPI000479444E|nr:hypothetical protein [Butyrivibrio proteoclasticus]